MTGKGDGRLHARQQCSDEEMQANWDRVFKKPNLTDLEVPKGDPANLTKVPDKHREKVADQILWVDELKGSGDTFEEKVSLSDEMQLHGEKHKPEGL